MKKFVGFVSVFLGVAVRIPTTPEVEDGIYEEARNKVDETEGPAKKPSEGTPGIGSPTLQKLLWRVLAVCARLVAEGGKVELDDADGKQPAEKSDNDGCEPPPHKPGPRGPNAENKERQKEECQ